METSAKNNTGVHDLFAQTAERVLQWQAEAIHGTGLPIPVTAGGTTKLPRASISPVKPSAASPMQQNRKSLIDDDKPARPLSPRTDKNSNNNNTSILDKATPDTDAEENDNPAAEDTVVDEKAQPIKKESVVCEGSMLVCGTDDKSCYVM